MGGGTIQIKCDNNHHSSIMIVERVEEQFKLRVTTTKT
jgi:hypothetical protein